MSDTATLSPSRAKEEAAASKGESETMDQSGASAAGAGASETKDASNSEGKVLPGEENILDDLLQQNHDHEMFDEEDESKKKEEEAKEGASNKAATMEELGTEPIDDHSDISDAESNHDDLLKDDDDHDRDDSKKEEQDDDGDKKGGDNNENKNGSSGKKDEEEKSSDSDSGSESEDPSKKEDAVDASNADANKTKRIVKAPSKTREKIEAPSSSGDEKNDESRDDESSDKPSKKKGKSYDYATKLNYLFREARFFLVKSNNAENVTLAKNKGVWSTPPANESRFNQAFEEARNVLLIYSVKESGKFTGLARLSTMSKRDGPQVSWVLPPGLSARGNSVCFVLR